MTCGKGRSLAPAHHWKNPGQISTWEMTLSVPISKPQLSHPVHPPSTYQHWHWGSILRNSSISSLSPNLVSLFHPPASPLLPLLPALLWYFMVSSLSFTLYLSLLLRLSELRCRTLLDTHSSSVLWDITFLLHRTVRTGEKCCTAATTDKRGKKLRHKHKNSNTERQAREWERQQ